MAGEPFVCGRAGVGESGAGGRGVSDGSPPGPASRVPDEFRGRAALEEMARDRVKPIIEADYIWKERPPKAPHYQVFCAILYILRTGCPWRDLPEIYGYWHAIYDRFSRGSARGYGRRFC
jgi:hypothetical protein